MSFDMDMDEESLLAILGDASEADFPATEIDVPATESAASGGTEENAESVNEDESISFDDSDDGIPFVRRKSSEAIFETVVRTTLGTMDSKHNPEDSLLTTADLGDLATIKAAMLEVFRTADVANSGSVDKSQFFEMMKSVLPKGTSSDYDTIFHRLDRDGEGHIPYRELFAADSSETDAFIKAMLAPQSEQSKVDYYGGFRPSPGRRHKGKVSLDSISETSDMSPRRRRKETLCQDSSHWRAFDALEEQKLMIEQMEERIAFLKPFEAETTSLKEEIDSLHTQMDALTLQIDEMTDDAERERAEHVELDEALVAEKQRSELLDARLTEARDQFRMSSFHEMHAKDAFDMDKETETVATLQSKVQDLEAELQLKSEELATMNMEVETSELMVGSLQRDNMSLSQDVGILKMSLLEAAENEEDLSVAVRKTSEALHMRIASSLAAKEELAYLAHGSLPAQKTQMRLEWAEDGVKPVRDSAAGRPGYRSTKSGTSGSSSRGTAHSRAASRRRFSFEHGKHKSESADLLVTALPHLAAGVVDDINESEEDVEYWTAEQLDAEVAEVEAAHRTEMTTVKGDYEAKIRQLEAELRQVMGLYVVPSNGELGVTGSVNQLQQPLISSGPKEEVSACGCMICGCRFW